MCFQNCRRKLSQPHSRKEQFLDRLPEKFNRLDYLDLAKNLSIPARTAENYILILSQKGLIFNEQYDSYFGLTVSQKTGKKEGT